jgi:hypothetical protein
VDEQEHPAGAEAPGPSAPDATPPVTEPAIAGPERRRRGEGAREALTSRGAGWVAAAVLAGAVVALSVVLATGSPATVLQVGAARLVPAGGRTEIVSLVPNGPLRASWVQIHGNAPSGSVTIVGPAAVQPGSVRVALPANAPPGGLRVEVPVVVLPAGRAQVPAGRWVQVPARVWVQVPAGVVVPAPTASPAKSTAH